MLSDVLVTERAIDTAKRALTTLLSTYVQQVNARASPIVLAGTLTQYVNQFNVLTGLTNQLYNQVQTLNTVPVAAVGLVSSVKLVTPVVTVHPK